MLKIILILLIIFPTYAQKRKIIYKYKKKESLDLGELSIKGNIISPGDLTSRVRDSRKLRFKIPERMDFDDYAIEDLKNSL